MYYGADYYPEHWPEERWDRDAELMAEAGINVVRMAEFAWTRMEPREAEYNFGWLDRAIEVLATWGIETVLGTPTAAPPAWLMRAYPECFLVTEDGRRRTYGMRREYCPTTERYREYSARIVRAMVDHFAQNESVIGWQIDNEFGGRCYCENCRRAFQQWLRRRYGSLDRLNRVWGTEFWSHLYTAWQEIPLPWSTAGTPNPSLALDYRRFMSDTYVGYQRLQIDVIREVAPHQPITHNLMGFGYPLLNYFDLARDLDFVSWDNYPRFRSEPDLAVRALSHDTMRGLKKRGFWVMEEQSGPTGGNSAIYATPRPGEIPFWAWQAIAHGADGMVYFRWRTCRFGAEEYWHGILDHDGVPRRRYDEVARMGAQVAKLGEDFEESQPKASVAMVLSYDSRFAFQTQPHNTDWSYEATFVELYRALYDRNVAADIVSPGDSFDQYSLLIVPALYISDSDLAQRLTAYVENGGLLLTTCRSGVMDEHNVVVNEVLPGLLADVCGIEVKEYDSHAKSPLRVALDDDLGGGEYTGRAWADVIDVQGARVLARYTCDYFAGEPAITAYRYGAGEAVYTGTVPNAALASALTDWLLARCGAEAPLDVPAGVEVALRESEEKSYLFLLNANDDSVTIDVGEGGRDLISGRDVEGGAQLDPLAVMVLQR